VATLTNVSEVTGRGESVTVFTTLLRDGNFFYCIAVVPQDEYQAYQRPFQRVTQSIRLSDLSPPACGFDSSRPMTHEKR
jgi:hypothetical protein